MLEMRFSQLIVGDGLYNIPNEAQDENKAFTSTFIYAGPLVTGVPGKGRVLLMLQGLRIGDWELDFVDPKTFYFFQPNDYSYSLKGDNPFTWPREYLKLYAWPELALFTGDDQSRLLSIAALAYTCEKTAKLLFSNIMYGSLLKAYKKFEWENETLLQEYGSLGELPRKMPHFLSTCGSPCVQDCRPVNDSAYRPDTMVCWDGKDKMYF
ncbi:hypothetical protein Ciccas_008930 [Cichlidogyrus casuarinus]|uniref:Uncharacterized protein n=1 Tax=Cichlidogyrus casuarinus TaxID=1844966 RepID=A0ABD2PYH6_9PLAT